MKKRTLYISLVFVGIIFGLPTLDIEAQTDDSGFNAYVLQHMKDPSFQEAKEKLTREEFKKWAHSQYEKMTKNDSKPSAQTSMDYDDLALDPFALNL